MMKRSRTDEMMMGAKRVRFAEMSMEKKYDMCYNVHGSIHKRSDESGVKTIIRQGVCMDIHAVASELKTLKFEVYALMVETFGLTEMAFEEVDTASLMVPTKTEDGQHRYDAAIETIIVSLFLSRKIAKNAIMKFFEVKPAEPMMVDDESVHAKIDEPMRAYAIAKLGAMHSRLMSEGSFGLVKSTYCLKRDFAGGIKFIKNVLERAI